VLEKVEISMNIKRALLTLCAAAFLALAPAVARADTWFECTPIQVTEASNRVDVLCSNSLPLSADTIIYVAIAKTDVAKASRFVSMATAAVLSGQIFRALVPTSSATNTAGCDPNNCRTPSTFGLRNGN
jgi:hypothetical protein